MQRIVTASPLAQWLSADCNLIQDRADGLNLADSNNVITDAGARLIPGGFLWIRNATITDTPVTIDASMDWRDRHFVCHAHQLGDVGSVPGGAADHLYGNNAVTTSMMYTGLGGQKSGGGAISAGNPPVQSSGIPSYAHPVLGILTDGLVVYSDPFDSHKLKIVSVAGHVNIGFSLVLLQVTGDLAKR